MRKTTIPVAVVLAASAVPMQAQEAANYTKESLSKRVGELMVVINNYPTEVKNTYSVQLSAIQDEINKLSDTPTQEELDGIGKKIEKVAVDAKAAQEPYAAARDAALNAKTDAETALNDANGKLDALVVPSVKKSKLEELKKLTAPTSTPKADELYKDIELAKSTKKAWDDYKSSIETLVAKAQGADKTEQAAQPGRKATLEELITSVNTDADAALKTIQGYLNYAEGDANAAAIQGVIGALPEISEQIETSLTAWELTEEKATKYTEQLDGKSEIVTKSADTAMKAAQVAAQADAEDKVSGLTPYDEPVTGNDDYIKAAKQAANAAIASANTKAEELATALDRETHTSLAEELDKLVTAANNAVAAVTAAQNNYDAYQDLVTTYNKLKAQYDKSAIELSTLKAQGKIDEQPYNEANGKLNVVAQNLQNLFDINETNYKKDRKYEGGTADEDYKAAKALLGSYTTVESIAQIVTDASGFNETLNYIKAYQTRVDSVVVTVTSEKYTEQAQTLTKELTDQKKDVTGHITELEEAFRVSKNLDPKADDDVEKAVAALEAAAPKARADMQAYEQSKEKVTGWTTSVETILGSIIIDKNFEAAEQAAYDKLVKDSTQAEKYKAELLALDSVVVDAFDITKHPERNSQAVWSIIKDKTYDTDLETLQSAVTTDMSAYNTWLNQQGDVAAYKLGLKYVEDLENTLQSAIDSTDANALGYAADADSIKSLKDSIQAKHKDGGHKYNDCIVALTTWKLKSDTINTSILAHKQAWIDNKGVYEEKKGKLEGIRKDDLFGKLIKADSVTIEVNIAAELTVLEDSNNIQNAAGYDVVTAVGTIKNSIAELVLKQEKIVAGIEDSLYNAEKAFVGKEELNPSSYYTNLLESYKKQAASLTTDVKYDQYKTKSDSILTLKAAIIAVPGKAEANYAAYLKQTTSQTEAKADWAKIYSSVGAKYGDQFAGAQKLYQDSLNVCFTVLTGYDEDIKTRYNNGTSAEFGTEAYNKAIAENKALMESIEKAAIDNKDKYDDQVENIGALNTSYKSTKADLVAKLKDIEDAIDTAGGDDTVSEEDKTALAEQQTALVGYLNELKAVENDIAALTATALEKVNAGESVVYATEFDQSNTNIRTDIGSISSKANGTYNANIEAHNKVIKQLFEDAYNSAKGVYHELVLSLEKYAGYKHALTEGKSAYAAEIEKANQAVFTLNTDLVDEYAKAYVEFDSCASAKYADKSQLHKTAVNGIKTKLEKEYDDFLAATQTIVNNSNYAKPLSDLKSSYEAALEDVNKNYTYKVGALKAFDGIDGGKLNAAYEAAVTEKKGAQVLDKLLAQVESLNDSVVVAYNNAAKVEADSTILEVELQVAPYKELKYPSEIKNLSEAVTAAETAISNAEDSITTHYTAKTLPEKLGTLLNGLSGIATSLSDAQDAADAAVRLEKAALQQEGGTWYNYNATIDSISTAISGYKNGEYAAKLTDLIATAEEKVTAATKANNDALAVLYENGKDAVETAITEAQTALQEIKKKVADLEANTPAGIVAALLKDAQALVPLYNRAEANAKGNSEAEEECKAIYTELAGLLTDLQTTDADKKQEIADAKSDYEAQISNLKTRIIAADLEQKAYNELLASHTGVNEELAAVKLSIENSDFKDELNTTFSGKVSEIEKSLFAAKEQINIDHANNLCGKESATVKAENIAAISASISKLSEDVSVEEARLAKVKADTEIRTANTKACESAKDSIGTVKSKLDNEWTAAQKDNVNVFTLFNDEVNGETGLYAQINALYTSLETAYNTAQNKGGDPSVLNTDNITSSVKSISSSIDGLMTRISERQAKYNEDVKALNTDITAMDSLYTVVKGEITEIAAADEDVQAKQKVIDEVIAAIDKKMADLGPNDIEDVQGLIVDANALIEELRELAAGKTYIPGDIDSDGKVDVLDLAVIRDLVSGKTDSSTLDENQQKAADMDADGEYTVADFVQVNNVYVYGNKLGQNKAVAKAAMKNQTEPGSVAMQMDTANMDVMLNSTVGYAAIQMDVTLPEGVSITEVEFSGESKSVMMTANMLDNGACRLMLYTVNSSNLLNGENRLLNLKLAGEGTGVVSIDRIIASTGAGQRHDLESVTGAYTIVTGIEAVEASEASKTSIFDINGMVRKTMQKGVNIVKDAAGKVKKILVK